MDSGCPSLSGYSYWLFLHIYDGTISCLGKKVDLKHFTIWFVSVFVWQTSCFVVTFLVIANVFLLGKI